MSLRQRMRWALFAVYVVAVAALPLGLLGGIQGAIAGTVVGITILFLVRLTGLARLLQKLRVTPLSTAECPQVHALLAEYSRRLSLPCPRVGVIENRSLNGAVIGFQKESMIFIVTRGALETLDRAGLGAFLARLLAHAAHGGVPNATWLSRFLSLIDFASNPRRTRPPSHSRRYYSFRTLLRQALLYPLTLIPVLLLKEDKLTACSDDLALRLSRRARDLAEVYRRMEALSERFPLQIPVSSRHLFLLPPPTPDPLARVFYETEPLGVRVKAIELQERVVAPA